MYISFRSERNFIAMNRFIDGQGLESYKFVKLREESPSNTRRYYIEKKGEIIVTILEIYNNKIFRLLFNIIILIIGFFGGTGSDFEDYLSLKYNRAKLVLRIVSNNLEDEIDIHHLIKNPPFNAETIQSYDNFSYEIIYNGRFVGKWIDEVNKIAGVEKKKKRKS